MFDVRPKDRIVFPPFVLDLVGGRLLRGPKPIELRPKAFRVLQYLLERPGQLVSKEELLEFNWPGVHVGDYVLKVSIAEIRKALSDSPRASRFIETAHRRGYRFIARTETPACSTSAPISFPATSPTMKFELRQTSDTTSGDTNITFQVLGKGPLDLTFEKGWTESSFAGLLRRLSSFSRLIPSDIPGRVSPPAELTFEHQMNAVIQGAGPKQRGGSEDGEISALLPATYQEPTIAFVIVGILEGRPRGTC